MAAVQSDGATVRRIGSLIGLVAESAEEYTRLHSAVWPDVLEVLRQANVTNYTIFRHADLLFSYMEYRGSDFEADMARVAGDPATKRWWAVVMPTQRTMRSSPEQDWWVPMDELFHLD
jgi:L-rhamnose mutarotase